MKRLLTTFFVLLLTGAAVAFAQEPPQEPPPEPAPPPRVVGESQTQAEADDWSALQQALTAEEQIQLANQFLQDHPNSGLIPFVHYRLANLYQQGNQPEKFIQHGEKALEELPILPDVLAFLAFFYAEQGKNSLAMERARAAMEGLSTMPKPPSLSDAEWLAEKYELSGESHYALGRVHLAQAMGQSGEEEKQSLIDAIQHLEQSLEQKPNHAYAAFRLAEAYSRQQDLERAIKTYARAVAMGGIIGDYARRNLQRVYEHVHENTEGMEEVINQQTQLFQQAMAERKQELELVALEEQEATETTIARPPK